MEAQTAADHAAPSSAAHAKVIVVMPARNAARTLEATVSGIPTDVVDEVILVDDKSTDATLDVARRLPVHLIWHPHNVGYGGNQKTCYLEALQRGADAVVMLHPDGQYEPSLIPRMVEPILSGQADMVLGSRLTEPGSWKQVGMPRYKFLANRGLTVIENLLLGTHFSELHTEYIGLMYQGLLDFNLHATDQPMIFLNLGQEPVLHKEPLEFHYVHPSQRSYK